MNKQEDKLFKEMDKHAKHAEKMIRPVVFLVFLSAAIAAGVLVLVIVLVILNGGPLPLDLGR